jgi:GNAT superfamily N-acetyltransferase
MSRPSPARLGAIAPLAAVHGVAAFDCGDRDIDRFLHDLAAAEQAVGLSQVYVVADSNGEVLAYFTLSPLTVRVETALLERLGLGGVPYPAIDGFLLGRLGVTKRLQRQGVGEALVISAARIAKRESQVVGGMFLAVDPKNDALMRGYAVQGFAALGSRTRRMILPLRRVPD